MANEELSAAVLKELQELRTRVAELEQGRRLVRPSRRTWAVLAATAAVSVAGVALASPPCSNGIPFCFQPNTPAQATEINSNFAQLKTWLEAKVGTVTGGATGTGPINTGAITATGAVSAGSLSTVGDTSFGGPGKTMAVFGTVQEIGSQVGVGIGTPTVASTDGFVTAVITSIGTCNSGPSQASGTVNGAIRGQASVHGGCANQDYTTPNDSFMFPVRKGESFVVNTQGNPSTIFAFFTPLGR